MHPSGNVGSVGSVDGDELEASRGEFVPDTAPVGEDAPVVSLWSGELRRSSDAREIVGRWCGRAPATLAPLRLSSGLPRSDPGEQLRLLGELWHESMVGTGGSDAATSGNSSSPADMSAREDAEWDGAWVCVNASLDVMPKSIAPPRAPSDGFDRTERATRDVAESTVLDRDLRPIDMPDVVLPLRPWPLLAIEPALVEPPKL